jgi:glycosyltransferase involved in cell wall biosynthesis
VASHPDPLGPAPISIAIVCDNASFRMGGEAAIPLRFFREFRALGARVQLLAHDRVRPELETILTPAERADVTFFPDQNLQRLIFRLGRVLPIRLQELFVFGLITALTERRQVRHLRALSAQDRIDVVFQPVPIAPRAISLIRLDDRPVYFGPLNGAMDYPPAFRRRSGRLTDLAVQLGRALAEPLHHIFPARKQAAGVFVSNPRTLAALPRAMARVPRYRSFDATADSLQWRDTRRGNTVDTDHFLYVGRLVDWKAVDIAIRATHALQGRARLTIVGDGPERSALERLAATGPGQITFAGFQPHDRIAALYARVTAQLLPSLREAGGNVCMEALAAGVPMIATRWGGAVDVIRDGIDGLLIPPDSEQTLVTGFADAMRNLMDNPARASAMGSAGRARVLDAFSWQTKARDILAIFTAASDPDAPSPPAGALLDAHPGHRDPAHVNCAWPGQAT